MKAYILFIFSLFTVAAGYSQSTQNPQPPQSAINNYKYVLVPARFDFSSEDNQYGLNTTAKLLLEEKGFTVFVGDEAMPIEVAGNKCNALKAEVVQRKGFFSTNLTLLLKDCQGHVIFKSKEGKSREKEFQPAYDLALRDAFSSLKDVPYKYDGTTFTAAQVVAVKSSVDTVYAQASAPAAASSAPSAVTDLTGSLYAQAIPNGYQVIDTTPKKVLTLLKTSVPDYFIAEAGFSNGIVFKKDGEWYYEYYKNNVLVSQKLAIKF